MSKLNTAALSVVILTIVGCQTANPVYTVDYPFRKTDLSKRVEKVSVRLTHPELFNPAPLSMAGLWSARAEVVRGGIPLEPERRSFVVRVRQHPVVDSFFQGGGGTVTMSFNEHGDLLGIEEFSETLNERQRSINKFLNDSAQKPVQSGLP